ncbi:hypothetical protein E4U41_005116 [Claviceps citrina]|nr:hypothetical protein E4U41_005116 [Claviceps citrina]
MADPPHAGAATLTSPDRLRKIDQLREINVGTHMPLPQLVVVGDQSSGKSSLLESLTGIPFPNGQGLCTRYATHITHRRDALEEVVVNARMGIKTQANPGGNDTFSRDVLRIEKCGPAEDNLTVIDVPGIFRNTEEGVTTETDKVLVLDMRIVRGALEANYSSLPEIEGDSLRLITDVVNITGRFNCEFARGSSAYRFEDEEDPGCCNQESCSCSDSGVPEPKPLRDGPGRFPELDSIIDMDWPESESGCPSEEEEDIMGWIRQMYSRSRGVEVGTFGPGLLSSAFREQSQKWEGMVKSYLSKIVLVIHHFIVTILGKICTDAKVLEEVQSVMHDELLDRYKAAMDQAVFLVEIERDYKPYTLNAAFGASLRGSTSRRITAPLVDQCAEDPSEDQYFDLDTIRRAIEEKPKGEDISEQIHDILRAYYKVARERVVDNLFRQAVNHCLLTGPASPLGLFSEKWVLGLDRQDLESIAGESRLVSHRREQLMKKIADLESALKILR